MSNVELKKGDRVEIGNTGVKGEIVEHTFTSTSCKHLGTCLALHTDGQFMPLAFVFNCDVRKVG